MSNIHNAQHRYEIVPGCVCGWTGEMVTSRLAADDAFTDHLVACIHATESAWRRTETVRPTEEQQ